MALVESPNKLWYFLTPDSPTPFSHFSRSHTQSSWIREPSDTPWPPLLSLSHPVWPSTSSLSSSNSLRVRYIQINAIIEVPVLNQKNVVFKGNWMSKVHVSLFLRGRQRVLGWLKLLRGVVIRGSLSRLNAERNLRERAFLHCQCYQE